MFFKKKSFIEKNQQDLNLIEENAKTVGILIQETKDENFRADLKKMQEKLRYLNPSIKSKAYDCDKKIKNLLEDLRITLVKCKDDTVDDKSIGLLKDIRLEIAEREVAE